MSWIHGHAKTGHRSREYFTWGQMIQRCHNPKDGQYHNYGARGIAVCERWRKFENFFEDMGKCPSGMSINRKDNDGNYEPDNCHWATLEEQSNNKRNNHWITYKGERKTVAQWARALNIPNSTLNQRLSTYLWPEERALSLPVQRRGDGQ